MIRRLIHSIRDFVREVKSELLKVSYPTRGETFGSTGVVIVFSIIVSLFLYMVDLFLVRLLRMII